MPTTSAALARRLLPLLALLGCDDGTAAPPVRRDAAVAAAAALVHLADETPAAGSRSAAAPVREERSWSFAEPRPDWIPLEPGSGSRLAGATVERLADGVRIAQVRAPGEGGMRVVGLRTELPALRLADWESVRVRARTSDRLSGVAARWNVEEPAHQPGPGAFMMGSTGSSPVFCDGSVQEYALPLSGPPGTELHSLGIFVGAPGPGGLDVLSVTLVPRGAEFAQAHGHVTLTRSGETRTTLYAHTPAELAYRVTVPEGGRLDAGLACLPGEAVTFTVSVRGGAPLLTETVDDADAWKQVSVDLSAHAGQTVELLLAASGAQGGEVALWGAPVVSGRGRSEHPNVVFYVIDGGGADEMSVYGYARRTTPFLERLALEGVLFERAYSNASWTQPSTASFMTSLQHSVLGGLRRGIHSTPVPEAAVTMAQHFRRAGYATASLTTNPNCARVIGLQRGVDVMDDSGEDDDTSSAAELLDRFRRFRTQLPGEPYWAHLQTTEVHEPNHPLGTFAGLYVSDEQRKQLDEWDEQLWNAGGSLFGTTSILHFYDEAIAKAGFDRHAFYNLRRGLYDETMAQQDDALRRFVDNLKATGEWDHTLLVIGADHGHPAGTFARWGRGLFEPKPPEWEGALFDSYATRVPLIFVWPGHLQAGQRVSEPVSMIDVLPTLLELAGLPPAEIAQGRSLAPRLLGRSERLPPVFLDEVRVAEPHGEIVGNFELIDGRWGASLEIAPPGGDATHGRHAVPAGGRWGAVHPFFPETPRLLLYDLADDPFALHAVNEQHPELVEKYLGVLQERWEAQRLLATRFTSAGGEALAPDQLLRLQQLGYVR